jgi:hypothetical protein
VRRVAIDDDCATGGVLLYELSTKPIAKQKENDMERKMSSRRGPGVLAAIAMLAVVASANAQTRGMDHRDDRRDDRQGGRAAKQECKAGDEKNRAECRQEKRTTKHGEGEAKANEAPAANPPQ